jgi:hypothetical protein
VTLRAFHAVTSATVEKKKRWYCMAHRNGLKYYRREKQNTTAFFMSPPRRYFFQQNSGVASCNTLYALNLRCTLILQKGVVLYQPTKNNQK